MLINANMSMEVYDYFKGHDLSQVANTLLEMYDFTNLPQITGAREKEVRLNITNEYYLSLYTTLGPRSKKLSLGRLFEFGYNMDVLAHSRFDTMKVNVRETPVASLVDRAYRALCNAQKYDSSDELKEITNLVYNYREVVKCRETEE